MKSALRYYQVVKRYGKRLVLDGFTLTVPHDVIFGVVGSNGAGKTTALAVGAGLLRTESGIVDLLDNGPFQAARHRGRVTHLPQDSRMPRHTRVTDVLLYYAMLQGMTRAQALKQIPELLDALHLTDRARSPIRTLSHGMQKRVAIAQAFLGDPELVMLDEPMNGLDPAEVVRARRFLDARRGRQTIVISSHLLGEVEALCDEVAFVEQGRCVKQDRLDALVKRDTQITYHLEGQSLPLDALQAAMPDARFQPAFDQKTLVVHFSPAQTPLAVLNQAVTAALAAAGVGLLEIRRGDALESTFLESRGQAG